MARPARLPSATDRGLLRRAERIGFRKGLGGNKAFFYLGTGLWTLRTVRRMAERKTEVLISETLEPGQRIVITNGRALGEQAQQQQAKRAKPKAEEKASRKQRRAERKQATEGAPS